MQVKVLRDISYSLLVLVLFSVSAKAQIDNPTGGIAIPRSKSTASPKLPAKADVPPPAPITPPKKTFSSADFKDDKPFSMEKKSEFTNRGSEYQQKVQASVLPRGESSEAFKGHMDFGIIKTKSGTLMLNMRDFGAEDGDRIKITQNDKILFSEILLNNNTRTVMISLSPGFNDIRIEALNQGTSGPNTGEFYLYDDNEKRLGGGEWNLMTGFHGKFLVVKED